ncbi:hypothetical protein ONE63_002054 [Megalurothrips usitatus]|uniref:Uncharacterized protein n=1 Tax=Megalurothrips usitatus TaxID=439358 RepID=A0AAV7XEX1_9NEOP|nr:hypothetical protein ONE63_002054 [Megalurothrips usitatus]
MDVDPLVRLFLLALLAAGSLAQASDPVIIKPVIVPGLPGLPSSAGAASADLHFDPSLEHAASRPEYAFAYGVEDPKSGNAQSHKEERDGDNVRGEYKVLDADGSVRTVTYTVDPKNGFQANVKQSDPSHAAAFKDEARKASNQADIPADIRVDIPSGVDAPDVPVDVSGPSADHADYFSGPSHYSSDFDP